MQNIRNRFLYTLQNSRNRLLYTIYFFIFCVIDQRVQTASGLDGAYEFFRNLMGIIMVLLILSHYRADDVRRLRKPYLVWSTAGLAAATGIFILGCFYTPLIAPWFLMVLGIFLFGYVAIYTFCYIWKEKKALPANKPLLITWAAMMVLMVLSKSDYAWPFFYLIMFGLFFLTSFTRKEKEDMFHGILNGIILSFFVFQAYCCVFRPYDVVRYVGIYTNSNIASLYYLEVLAAVMTKYLWSAKTNARICFKLFYWLGLGVVLSFLFMCIGRTAWIVAFVMCMVFLIVLNKVLEKKRIILNGLALLLCACIMFPCTFGIVRYTPPFFHHTVWFWGEYNESKVHSFDPWNSEKYVEMDELLAAALGRLTKTITDMLEQSPFAISANAAETDSSQNNQEDRREEIAVLTYEEGENGILVRKTIYSHYLRNLNLWGHKQNDQGFQLTGTYWIGHAHNIYLQYGTDFGIPTLAVFIGFSLWTCVVLIQGFKKGGGLEYIGYLLFALIPLTFGLFEYCWGVSTISIQMLFMAWGKAITSKTDDIL